MNKQMLVRRERRKRHMREQERNNLERERARKHRAKLRKVVYREFNSGAAIQSIATKLAITHAMTVELINETLAYNDQRVERHKRELAAGKQIVNPWLDPLDDANIDNYWVPTPEEIEATAKVLRQARETGDLSVAGIIYRCHGCGALVKRQGRCGECARQVRRVNEPGQTQQTQQSQIIGQPVDVVAERFTQLTLGLVVASMSDFGNDK